MDIQLQDLGKGRQMTYILKGKQYKKVPHLMTSYDNQNTIKKPFKEIGIPVLSFKRAQEAAPKNSNILAASDESLG